MKLDSDSVNRLVLALLEAGLGEQRAALVGALKPLTRASLPTRSTPFDQLFGDVDSLNAIPVRRGGERAFEAWLARARQLAPTDEAVELVDAAMVLVRDPAAPTGARAGAAPPAGPPVEVPARSAALALEALTGARNAMVRIDWLTVGVARSHAVVRIRRGATPLGTGFLVEGGRIVTNHHVLPDRDRAAGAVADFGYEDAPDGTSTIAATCELRADDGFRASQPDDLAVIPVVGVPDGVAPLPLGGTAPLEEGAFVHIVQHPGGGAKRIALYRNVVTWIGPGLLQYLTDTDFGSSGSPVFDRDWNVVAVHHGAREVAGNTGDKMVVNEGITLDRLRALLG